jgi:alginate production protein
MQATALAVALGAAPDSLAEAAPDGSEDASPRTVSIGVAARGLHREDAETDVRQDVAAASFNESPAEPASSREAAPGQSDTLTLRRDDDPAPPAPTAEQRAVLDAPVSELRLAQFQLPPTTPKPAAPGDGTTTIDPTTDSATGRRPRTLAGALTYQYGYGSESQISYLRNPDLNKHVSDNLLIVAPQINGIFIYRPTDWLEATLEMIASVEIPSHQPETITLPNGQVVFDQPTRSELLVDQGFVSLKRVIAPFDASVGRRNYEDERHWLYDGSLDVGALTFRQGALRVDAFAGREVYKNLDLIPGQFQVKDRINTGTIYVDYRGIEDFRLAAYQINRHDLSRTLGYPRLTGVRAMGRPSDELNFWAELAYNGGRDPLYNKYSGRGFDVGFTYRFLDLPPLRPNFTLSYAYGSGESNPGGATNHTFLQTGLQSNEQRWAGVTKFKYYGEVLDPELSNLKIFTVGLGFWPAPSVTVDLVFHKYTLAKLADEVAGSPITALMAQVDSQLSRTVGNEFDIVIGLRNLFGLRRLGVDLRMGWFFPGKAFRRNDGTDEDPLIRRADNAFVFIAKFWW